jgi:hypothetical protein
MTMALEIAAVQSIQLKSLTKWATTGARLLLGLTFFVFGLNGFLNFIPPPSGHVPEGAMAFGGAIFQTGYLWQLLKGTEVLVGALLLANRFVPLALVIIAPVVVNIFAFHLFLEPSGLALAAAIVALELFLAWSYRAAFRGVLVAKV